MPPIVKKIIIVFVMLILVNIGFVWYGQASFDATFQGMARAFVDQNLSVSEREIASLPDPIAKRLKEIQPYRVAAFQQDGQRFDKHGKPMPMHGLVFMHPAIQLLDSVRVDTNAVVIFNAISTYRNAKAKMKTSLFGLIPVGEYEGEAFARSQLAKLLAYGLFNPLLLASEAVTYRREKGYWSATIEDHGLRATVRYYLDAKGQITTVESDDCVIPSRSGLKPIRWRMRILRYARMDGVTIPVEVEESKMVKGQSVPMARYRVDAYQLLR
jgi:hypothetical protein